MLSDRIDRLEQSREQLSAALPLLEAGLVTVVPKIKFFEGKDGVKQILKDIMWHDHITLHIIWPYTEMEHVFDAAFLQWFDERRKVRQLSAEVITNCSDFEKSPTLLTGGKKDVLRSLSKDVILPMATIIYDAKVATISSQKESFGFIVESKEFSNLERLKFASL